jgi:hypothetical protein
MAGIKLRSGNLLAFAKWYLPSLALLNIGGSLVELSATAGASLVVANFVNSIFLYRLQRQSKSVRRKLVESEQVRAQLAAE